MKNKLWLYSILSILCLLLAAGAIGLDRFAPLPDPWDGLFMGGGVGLGVFFLSQALMEGYYVKNKKARRMMEVEERDERTQSIRGMAAYRSLVASTPVFLCVWLVLLFVNAPLAATLAVCGGHLVNFGIYMYHLVKLQKEM